MLTRKSTSSRPISQWVNSFTLLGSREINFQKFLNQNFRKRIELRPEEALFFFVNGTIPATSNTMGEVFHNFLIFEINYFQRSIKKITMKIVFCISCTVTSLYTVKISVHFPLKLLLKTFDFYQKKYRHYSTLFCEKRCWCLTIKLALYFIVFYK